MPDDPLNTDPLTVPTTPTPAPARSGPRTRCVFCECVMTGDGQDVYHLGDKAKAFAKLDERLAEKDAEIAKLNEKVSALNAELTSLRVGTATPTRRIGERIARG